MRILAYFLISVGLFIRPISGIADTSPSAADISARVEREGPATVLKSIYADDRQWAQLLAEIATGRREWMVLAVTLYAASDAGSREQLTLAVGEALEHRPENVLSMALDTYPLNAVCDVPDTDDPRFDSLPRALATLNRREAKLRAATTPWVGARRDQCVAQLESAKTEIRNFYRDRAQREAPQASRVLQPSYRRAINAWLARFPNFRLATVADCECSEDVEHMRRGYGGRWLPVADYDPYSAIGDFNGDAIGDFAVVLMDTSKSANTFVLVVFNGPFPMGGKTPAFIESDLDLRHQGLFFGPPRPKPYRLVVGPFESDGDVLDPMGSTYRWSSGEDE